MRPLRSRRVAHMEGQPASLEPRDSTAGEGEDPSACPPYAHGRFATQPSGAWEGRSAQRAKKRLPARARAQAGMTSNSVKSSSK